jgi:hypothetical protein
VLLHASTVDGTNALWPLRRFDDYDRYRRIYAIRRLRHEFRYPGEAPPVSREPGPQAISDPDPPGWPGRPGRGRPPATG